APAEEEPAAEGAQRRRPEAPAEPEDTAGRAEDGAAASMFAWDQATIEGVQAISIPGTGLPTPEYAYGDCVQGYAALGPDGPILQGGHYAHGALAPAGPGLVRTDGHFVCDWDPRCAQVDPSGLWHPYGGLDCARVLGTNPAFESAAVHPAMGHWPDRAVWRERPDGSLTAAAFSLRLEAAPCGGIRDVLGPTCEMSRQSHAPAHAWGGHPSPGLAEYELGGYERWQACAAYEPDGMTVRRSEVVAVVEGNVVDLPSGEQGYQDQDSERREALQRKWALERALGSYKGHWLEGPRTLDDEMGPVRWKRHCVPYFSTCLAHPAFRPLVDERPEKGGGGDRATALVVLAIEIGIRAFRQRRAARRRHCEWLRSLQQDFLASGTGSSLVTPRARGVFDLYGVIGRKNLKWYHDLFGETQDQGGGEEDEDHSDGGSCSEPSGGDDEARKRPAAFDHDERPALKKQASKRPAAASPPTACKASAPPPESTASPPESKASPPESKASPPESKAPPPESKTPSKREQGTEQGAATAAREHGIEQGIATAAREQGIEQGIANGIAIAAREQGIEQGTEQGIANGIANGIATAAEQDESSNQVYAIFSCGKFLVDSLAATDLPELLKEGGKQVCQITITDSISEEDAVNIMIQIADKYSKGRAAIAMGSDQPDGFMPFCGAYGRLSDSSANGIVIVRPSKAPKYQQQEQQQQDAVFNEKDYIHDEIDATVIEQMFEESEDNPLDVSHCGNCGKDVMLSTEDSSRVPEIHAHNEYLADTAERLTGDAAEAAAAATIIARSPTASERSDAEDDNRGADSDLAAEMRRPMDVAPSEPEDGQETIGEDIGINGLQDTTIDVGDSLDSEPATVPGTIPEQYLRSKAAGAPPPDVSAPPRWRAASAAMHPSATGGAVGPLPSPPPPKETLEAETAEVPAAPKAPCAPPSFQPGERECELPLGLDGINCYMNEAGRRKSSAEVGNAEKNLPQAVKLRIDQLQEAVEHGIRSRSNVHQQSERHVAAKCKKDKQFREDWAAMQVEERRNYRLKWAATTLAELKRKHIHKHACKIVDESAGTYYSFSRIVKDVGW
ncbi:unnamed protein product, partial [Prorocentrum cordatum]